jgi:hypothetical protein
MKLVLFVEGHTEKALPELFKRWLDPQLSRPIGIKVVRFEGWRDYYGEIGKKVALNLSGKTGADVVGAVGLLDLYGLTFYPPEKLTANDRYRWAKTHIEQKVNHSKFRQHFAVHETEAWLLSQPSLLPPKVRDALPGKCGQPETVNFDEPPARLLDRLYSQKLRTGYKKVIDGRSLFGKLDPEVARARCPMLKLMLDEMLELARSA